MASIRRVAGQTTFAVLCALLVMSGCSLDNGTPGALVKLLGARGLTPTIVQSDAPLRSRAGFIAIQRDASVEAQIIAKLSLVPIGVDDAALQLRATKLPSQRIAAWGIAGRPRVLALADGAQLEYLYLVHAADGLTYLVTEFAYG